MLNLQVEETVAQILGPQEVFLPPGSRMEVDWRGLHAVYSILYI